MNSSEAVFSHVEQFLNKTSFNDHKDLEAQRTESLRQLIYEHDLESSLAIEIKTNFLMAKCYMHQFITAIRFSKEDPRLSWVASAVSSERAQASSDARILYRAMEACSRLYSLAKEAVDQKSHAAATEMGTLAEKIYTEKCQAAFIDANLPEEWSAIRK